MKWKSIALTLLLSSVFFADISLGIAGEKWEENRRVVCDLNEYMDMKDFQNPMTLKEAFGLTRQTFTTKGKDLGILVEMDAFKRENPEMANIYDTAIQFQPYPRRMRVSTALQIMLSKMTGRPDHFVRAVAARGRLPAPGRVSTISSVTSSKRRPSAAAYRHRVSNVGFLLCPFSRRERAG